ncbi:MAG: TRAP transporter small permease subunit [Hyphomicrobiales bacterium]
MAHDSGATAAPEPGQIPGGKTVQVLRILALCTVALALLFIFNNYLIFWRKWPGVTTLYAHLGLFGLKPLRTGLDGGAVIRAIIQLLTYLVPVALLILMVVRSKSHSLRADADRLTALAAFIVRWGFWSVLLIGLADMTISFLRVEGFLADLIGAELAQDLGRSRFRGEYVHYPLMGLSLIIAYFTRTLGFIWLALLIVVAELQIVIARFVFSYEQAFMADLVRFWYGAMFLFASAYTLLAEGHVRVDILYAGLSERAKAWSNLLGSLLFGIPLCWIILTRGMWGKTNVVNGPMLNYEVTQSGFGLYVKYLMAGFLVVYALSMLIQFVSYCLTSVAVLQGEPNGEPAPADEHPVV